MAKRGLKFKRPETNVDRKRRKVIKRLLAFIFLPSAACTETTPILLLAYFKGGSVVAVFGGVEITN
jgi:hypothetical protein